MYIKILCLAGTSQTRRVRSDDADTFVPSPLCLRGNKKQNWRKMKLKQRNGKKKIGSLVLAAAMIITSFPAFGTEVQAAEAGSAAPVQFVTKEQLKTFNTDDTDGKNPAKVYFGKNNGNSQEWWIAGSQKADSVTLFAASPLGANQKFDSNYTSGDSSTRTKTYSADWGCGYSGSAPSDVNTNHYGASTLRDALKGLETSCFSTAEKALMQKTTIYTNDTKNNCAYSRLIIRMCGVKN